MRKLFILMFGIMFLFLLGNVNATWTADLNTELIAYYSLDESTGTTFQNNVSIGTNDGVGNSSNIAGGNGILGNGGKFNKSDWIGMANFVRPTQTFSITAWINWTGCSDEFCEIVAGDDTYTPDANESTFYNMIYTGNSHIYSQVYKSGGGAVQAITNFALSKNVWHFYTMTYNGTTLNVYVDGVLNATAGSGTSLSPGTGISIGINSVIASSEYHMFGGQIDEVGIWNRTLSQAEITQLYNGGAGISFNGSSNASTLKVNLNSPTNGYNSASSSVTFNGSAISQSGNILTNVSIFTNIGGNWAINQTNNSGINNTAYIFNINGIPNGDYIWNYQACDNSSTCSFNSTNYTFSVNVLPTVNLFSPANGTTSSSLTQTFITNSSANANLSNSTLYIWHSNGTLANPSEGVYNNNMWVVSYYSGLITKIFPNGTMTNYSGFSEPYGLAYDGNGNMWVIENVAANVKKVNILTGEITNCGDVGSSLNNIAYDGNGSMWITSWNTNNIIRVYTSNCTSVSYSGVGSSGAAGIAYDGNGSMWVSDFVPGGFVMKVNITTGAVAPYYGTVGGINIGVDGNGNMWTANYYENSATKIFPNGTMTNYTGLPTYPTAVRYDNNGSMWFADYGANAVTKLNMTTGAMTHYYGTCNKPNNIAYDGNGSMWVVCWGDGGGNDVTKINMTNGAMVNYSGTGTGAFDIASDGTQDWNLTNILTSEGADYTNYIFGTSNSTNWTYTLPIDGTYYWNVNSCDSFGNCAFNSTNYTLTISASDTTHPYFTLIPDNATITYGDNWVGVDFDAEDETLFDTFAVNDTTNFQINSTGFLLNKTNFAVGVYKLNITINDSSNNINWIFFYINVSEIGCEENLQYTDYSEWSNEESCQITDEQEQSRYRTQYDANNCGTFENVTEYDYQDVACNYCSYSLANTSWSNWINLGCIINIGYHNESRNLTEYDKNYNICYIITEIESDLWNGGNNKTFFEYKNVEDETCPEEESPIIEETTSPQKHPLPTQTMATCDKGLLYCFAEWASNVTTGAFWIMALLAFSICLFLATLRFGSNRAFGFASFVGMIGGIFLSILKLTTWWVGSIFILLGVIGLAVMLISEK